MQVPHAHVCADKRNLDRCAIIAKAEKDTLVVQMHLLCMFIQILYYSQLYK